ncbi:hypothetical protein AMS68_007631 [Peltaster fructicola]|uniref:Dephospho-CoA kinase n=1 Tax=Peltaster fructicola TaxID=286661 RepID=A0A6H0Y514_9PEZI|nr:hypothetical protein AMS68_007631 [Peltaster fructicola]
MLLLGLTGSIATGKSTVSSILSSSPYNIPIIDADKVARQVVEPGTQGYAKIVEHFGPSTPDLLLPATPENGGEHGPTGKGRPLNRPALGRRVFGQGTETDRKALNRITHPAVRKEMYRQMLLAYVRGCWCVVLDVPLLFESGWEPLCGTIMVVAVTEASIQKQRLMARDEHLTEEDASNRIASQLDVREKARRALARGEQAGVVLWNDGSKEDLRKQIDAAMVGIKSKSPRWWALLLLLCPPLAVLSGTWSFVRSWPDSAIDTRCHTVSRPAVEQQDDDTSEYNGPRHGNWTVSSDGGSFIDDRIPVIHNAPTAIPRHGNITPLQAPLIAKLYQSALERRARASVHEEEEEEEAGVIRSKHEKRSHEDMPPKARVLRVPPLPKDDAQQSPFQLVKSPDTLKGKAKQVNSKPAEAIQVKTKRAPSVTVESVKSASVKASQAQSSRVRILGKNGEEAFVVLPHIPIYSPRSSAKSQIRSESSHYEQPDIVSAVVAADAIDLDHADTVDAANDESGIPNAVSDVPHLDSEPDSNADLFTYHPPMPAQESPVRGAASSRLSAYPPGPPSPAKASSLKAKHRPVSQRPQRPPGRSPSADRYTYQPVLPEPLSQPKQHASQSAPSLKPSTAQPAYHTQTHDSAESPFEQVHTYQPVLTLDQPDLSNSKFHGYKSPTVRTITTSKAKSSPSKSHRSRYTAHHQVVAGVDNISSMLKMTEALQA